MYSYYNIQISPSFDCIAQSYKAMQNICKEMEV